MADGIADLCRYVGVHTEYRGFEGQTVPVAQGTCIAVLRALGLDVATGVDAGALLRDLQSAQSLRPAPYEVIVSAGKAAEVKVSRFVRWSLEAESGPGVLDSGEATSSVSLPALPVGIHKLCLSAGSRDFTTWVLARPDRAVTLADLSGQPRLWGVIAALYGLTDGGAAPIGSYELLGKYAAALAAHGADFVGINPVHAMGQVRPDDIISPYSPSHRGFVNTWHITGATTGAPRGQSGLIDYRAALRANDGALRAEFAAFRDLCPESAEAAAFRAFVADQGRALREFALFEVLSADFGPDWRLWPAQYRCRDADALETVTRDHGEAVQFVQWAQWRASGQLRQAQAAARGAGMRIGLYLDLAVGPRLGGAETWAADSALVTGATLGAPPDPLGPTGQSWGLAPLSPITCREQGYAGFARLLRGVMRHAGMIRIDHVLGLMRSFWIPEGSDAGTYVSYPLDAMLAVVAIESARSGTIVVGEDLGLVPAGLREKLAGSGIYGLDVLQYMRTADGGFTDTRSARELAVCGFATHDTPTIAGFFTAEDARVRAGFGGIDRATLARTRADRRAAGETLGGAAPVREIHRRLAGANAGMVAVQLDDVAERTAQQNMPGTVDEYPNWRLEAPFSIRDIETAEEFISLGSEMRAQNRSNPNRKEKDHDLPDHSHNTD